MPQYLYDKWKKDDSLKKLLRNIFDKFYNKSDLALPDHFMGKYLEVYEKDKMCGLHIFLLKPVRALSTELQRIFFFFFYSLN